MRNIHVIPTDKPSRLCFNKDKNKFTLKHKLPEGTNSWKTHNIYITNDEEIKEEEDIDKHTCIFVSYNGLITTLAGKDIGRVKTIGRYYKIILTTDQDLIADGVQSIDDEFLEWFVKNSSCEETEVQKFNGFAEDYLIIIPKEEPKQFVECKCTNAIQAENCIRNCGHGEEPKQEEYQSECICDKECRGYVNVKCKKPKQVWEQLIEDCGGKEEFMKSAGLLPKQLNPEDFRLPKFGTKEFNDLCYKFMGGKSKSETLEEYKEALKQFPESDQYSERIGFEGGAKWQKERSYSEEEAITNIELAMIQGLTIGQYRDLLIEQFKNK